MIITPPVFTARILAEVELVTTDPLEIDATRFGLELLTLELAEVLAGVASIYEINLPDRDEILLARLRRYGRPAPGLIRGAVAFTPEGVPALAVGAGGTVESDGEDLVHLMNAPAGRYAEFWTIPDMAYWEIPR